MSFDQKSNKKIVGQKVAPKNIFSDIDPRDPIVVIDDIISHLQEMQEMLIAERELEQNPAKRHLRRAYERRRSINRHPLLILSRRYSELAQDFLNEFWFEQQKMVLQYGLEVSIDDLSEEIDQIAWLHPVILSKTWRYLTEKTAPPRLITAPAQHPSLNQLPAALFVIEDCIKKSTSALNSFVKKRDFQNERAGEMLKLLGQIKQGIQLTR